jgi:SAM-dependent methyltransferase
MSRSPFDALATEYDAARPSYPDGLYDALDELAGPLDGALVAEVGAGTGISTRGLLSRGADVVAYDLAPNMLERLRANGSPGPGALLGAAVADAHALPLRDGVADVVTYAQAFHWVRGPEAAREAARVLRPDGALALWWNNSAAQDEPWWQRQQDALEAVIPTYDRGYRAHDVPAGLHTAFDSVETAEVPWVRLLDVETYVTFLASKSYVASLGDRTAPFLDEQRAVLTEAFPDGTVEEPYVTRLWVAR